MTALDRQCEDDELREMIDTKAFDLLRDFSRACREEFESLRTQNF